MSKSKIAAINALNLYAPCTLNMADSYGLLSAMLARQLTQLHCRVNVAAFGGAAHESQPPDIARIVRQPYRAAAGGVFIGYPTNYHKHLGFGDPGPRLAVTMFESSRIPQEWPSVLNALDGVIVPSHFCREAFQASGVVAPIHVVPLGIGEIYRFAARPVDRPLTFLACLDRGARKGWMVALQAFLMAFGDDPNFQLVLKGRKPKQRLTFTNANFTVIQRDMDEEELYRLYLDADVLINPNKGEGFGLIPREASASGCIALATAWGGTADDIDQWGWRLPYKLERADWPGHRAFAGRDLGEWATCDAGEVAKILRDVADNRARYQAEAALKAQAAARYTWRRFAEGVLEIWKEVADGARSRAVHAA